MNPDEALAAASAVIQDGPRVKFLPTLPVAESEVCPVCKCGAHGVLHLERILAVGFGDVSVTRNGERVYSESAQPESEYWTGEDAERIAKKDPDTDWRIEFFAPLYNATYQRQGEAHWVLVEKGRGFA